MTSSSRLTHSQSGAYLLEALIGILIFSLGVLGIVGLQAAALRTTNDDALRAEAVLAANQYIGQMWTDNVDDPFVLPANYGGAGGAGGPKYLDFVNKLSTAFGGAYDPTQAPTVLFNAAPSTNSKSVQVVITWRSGTDYHNVWISGVIGTN